MRTRLLARGRLLLFAALLFATVPAAADVPFNFFDETLLTGLNRPVSLAFLPDGRLLVIDQKTAEVRVLTADFQQTAAIGTIPDVNHVGFEQGLLGIAVDPGWPLRPYLYFQYDHTGGTLYLSRYTMSGHLNLPQSLDLVLGERYDILTDIPDANEVHNSGTLRFDAYNRLYVSTGDDNNRCAAQDSTSFCGAILRLDVSGLPPSGSGPPPKSLLRPAGNPFPPTDDNAALVFCFGMRNPFRYSIDVATGRVFIGDVGWGTFEELNLATGGENFGWPFREGPAAITVPGGLCQEPGGQGAQTYDAPLVAYERFGIGSAVICGPVYRSFGYEPNRFPTEYEGAIFYSDFDQGFVRVLSETGSGWEPVVAAGQPTSTDWGSGFFGVSGWIQGPDGALYYSRIFDGELHRITYREPVAAPEPGEVPGPAFVSARPNPVEAGRTVQVNLGLPSPEEGRVTVVDVRGRRVRTLLTGTVPAVPARVAWDGRDEAGRRAPPGVYFVDLATRERRASVRVVVLP